MTSFPSSLRRRYVLAAFLVAGAAPLVANAQQTIPVTGAATAALPTAALQAVPARTPSGTRLTLSLPPGVAAPARVRVALYEAGGPALAADIRRDARDWQTTDGRAQLSLQIEAAPGHYELALVSDDKARTRLPYAAAPVEIAGIERTPGWWLPGGSSFLRAAERDENEVGAPLFIPGLQRSQDKKMATPDVAYLPDAPFKTLPLEVPTAAWLPGYDPAPLRAALQASLAAAAAKNERGYWGVDVTLQDPPALATTADGTRVAALVRAAISGAAPGAAMVLVQRCNFFEPGISRPVQSFAARCDAVFVQTYAADLDRISWTTKQFRRVAEEQPSYDLPILVELVPTQGYSQRILWTGAAQLEVLLAGATALVRTGGYGIDIGGPQPVFDTEFPSVIERNRTLFVNSVTLEDMGLLPAPEGSQTSSSSAYGSLQTRLYLSLREAGRIPLLARLESEDPESLAVALGNRVSDGTVRALKNLAERGTRIYIEGAPMLDETGTASGWKLKDLVGADVKPLDTAAPTTTEMSLDDGWTFGTGRGTHVKVQRSVMVTLTPPTPVTNIKSEKGIYRPVGARVAAKLADGTPGLVINTVGKGEVVWMPHQIAAAPSAGWTDLRQAKLSKAVPKNRTSAEQLYYAAIAAYIQPGLVSLKSAGQIHPEPTVTSAAAKPGDAAAPTYPPSSAYSGAANVRVAMRRSAKGTILLGLFNDDDRAARVEATVDGAAGIALDLRNETALPLDVRGFASATTVTIPAHGWSLIAFATSRDALNAERATPVERGTLR